MTVVLWDINVTKRRKNNTLNDTGIKDWSLNDYYRVAQQCIGTFATGDLAKSMLKSEDAISFVAEHLMYASFRWKPDGGRTINAYLNQCAIWCIPRWVSLSKKATSTSPWSINIDINKNDTKHNQLYATIADTHTQSPDKILMDQEQTLGLAKLINSAGLTERQQYCVEVVYLSGEKPAHVARNLGISRQAVDQCITKGIHKIKAVADGKAELFFA